MNEIESINKHITNIKSNNMQYSECVKTFLKYEGLSQIDRKVLVTLVDEIFIGENNNITINFKFKDELKKYCSFIH